MDFNIRGAGGMPGSGMPRMPANAPMFLIIPGIGLILFGAVLIANPQLLVYMVAGIFFLIGGLLLMAGWRAKKMFG